MNKTKNEVTGPEARKLAGKILRILRIYNRDTNYLFAGTFFGAVPDTNECITIRELKTLAASALTQSPDKPKKNGAKRR